MLSFGWSAVLPWNKPLTLTLRCVKVTVGFFFKALELGTGAHLQ